MSTCDKSVWEPAGKVIAAKDFTANNLADRTEVGSGWGDSVTFRISTDPNAVSILDIHDFKSNMWVEYQVDLATAKAYKLTMRYQTTASTPWRIYVDKAYNTTGTLNSNGAWAQTSLDISGTLSAGQHTIRVEALGGNMALNWLKVE